MSDKKCNFMFLRLKCILNQEQEQNNELPGISQANVAFSLLKHMLATTTEDSNLVVLVGIYPHDGQRSDCWVKRRHSWSTPLLPQLKI